MNTKVGRFDVLIAKLKHSLTWEMSGLIWPESRATHPVSKNVGISVMPLENLPMSSIFPSKTYTSTKISA